MINTEFKERLEEILSGVWASGTYDQAGSEQECITYLMPIDTNQATKLIIELMEDYTKAIVGEEENGYELGVISGEKYARRLRNLFRQTINQTSKTILRGTE